jgi:hypothetical protein
MDGRHQFVERPAELGPKIHQPVPFLGGDVNRRSPFPKCRCGTIRHRCKPGSEQQSGCYGDYGLSGDLALRHPRGSRGATTPTWVRRRCESDVRTTRTSNVADISWLQLPTATFAWRPERCLAGAWSLA